MLVLLYIVASAYVLLLGGLCLLSVRKDGAAEGDDFPPLSVVIAARNEAERLERNLPSVLAQSYPGEWEVCLVLDRCNDGSLEVARKLQASFPRLRIIEIAETPPGWAPKKWALTQGIKAAAHSSLVFTDADCVPEENWLMQMGNLLQNEHGSTNPSANKGNLSGGEAPVLILGLSPYQKRDGLLNAFIRFETYYTAVQYVAWAKVGQPYMAVGRNLAYNQALFDKVEGFSMHKDRLSGDDDLLVNAVGSLDPKPEVKVNTDPKGKVISEPETTWKSWFRQKLRHLSAGTGYRSGALFILSLFHGLHAIFYISLTLVLCCTPWTEEALVIYLVRTLLAWITLALPASKWAFQAPLFLYPLLDILYLFYNFILVPASLFHQPKWKGN